MNLADPFYERSGHIAIDLPGSRAVFTTRRGGQSLGPFASLNLGLMTDDDQSAVQQNRAALERELGIALRFLRQVHGARVLVHDGPGAAPSQSPGAGGWPEHAGELPEADGQATTVHGLAPAALTADCLPIVLAGGDAVAVVHAGWRGLAAGVIAAGARALESLGAGRLHAAAIGPGAGGCCYEVGPEVHEAFASAPPDAHRGAKLDLKAIARHQLEQAGAGAVYDVSLCTICSDPELLFSHRRDHGRTGRQAGIAWLT